MLTRAAGSVRSGRKLPHWRARRVLAYVETHLSERITLDALARQACLSVSQFSRCFKSTFGVTVHHYLMRFLGGQLSDEDVEVTEVAWVPLAELDGRLAYADERRLVRRAAQILEESA